MCVCMCVQVQVHRRVKGREVPKQLDADKKRKKAREGKKAEENRAERRSQREKAEKPETRREREEREKERWFIKDKVRLRQITSVNADRSIYKRHHRSFIDVQR